MLLVHKSKYGKESRLLARKYSGGDLDADGGPPRPSPVDSNSRRHARQPLCVHHLSYSHPDCRLC